jgi:hypothetical protein
MGCLQAQYGRCLITGNKINLLFFGSKNLTEWNSADFWGSRGASLRIAVERRCGDWASSCRSSRVRDSAAAEAPDSEGPHHRARAYVEETPGRPHDLVQRRLRGGTVVRGAPAQRGDRRGGAGYQASRKLVARFSHRRSPAPKTRPQVPTAPPDSQTRAAARALPHPNGLASVVARGRGTVCGAPVYFGRPPA